MHLRDHGVDRVRETHRSYDSLQYPLMHVYGEDGYDFNWHQVNPSTGEPTGKKVSCQDILLGVDQADK